MAEFVLENPAKYPNGTLVGAYPVHNWPTPGEPSGAPLGSATSTQTVSGGKLTFSGLAEGSSYWVVGEVGGVYRYATIYIPIKTGTTVNTEVAEELLAALLAKQVGVTVMSQTDAGISSLQNNATRWVYCGENPNVTRPEVPHVVWIIKEGIAPNHAKGAEPGEFVDAIWYLAEL